MKLQKMYASLITANLVAAEGFYTKLLGREPDYRPMDTLVQWELFEQGGLMLSSSDEIAGDGVMFLYVDDLAAERRRLQGLDIALGDDIAIAVANAGADWPGYRARGRHSGRLFHARAATRPRRQSHHACNPTRPALPTSITATEE